MKKMTTFIKLFASSFILFLLNFSLYAQSSLNDFEKGKIFVRTLDTLSEIPSKLNFVDLKDAYFLESSIIENFQISSVTKPFFAAKDMGLRSIYLIEFDAHEKTQELFRILENHSKLEYAELMSKVEFSYVPNDLGPNNANYLGQWYLYTINAMQAWDIARGDSNIVVAIVDNGINQLHPDLKNAIWKNKNEIPNNGIDDDGNGYIDDYNGYHTALNSSNSMPSSLGATHGTAISGLIGAEMDNGIGIASIGSGVRLMSSKGHNLAELMAGIIYATDANAKVINLSWGVYDPFSYKTMHNVIKYADKYGAILVAAAGNFYSSSPIYIPASFDEVITVAATKLDNSKVDFSNYGPHINISAPGESIWTTTNGVTSFNENVYNAYSGTSLSTGIVTGVVALMLSENPHLSSTQVKHCLYSTANPTLDYVGDMGAGIVDAYQAVLCAQSYLTLAPEIKISMSDSAICNANLIKFRSWSTKGPIDQIAWSFPGGSPAFSSEPNPQVMYYTPGIYNVEIIVSNAYGADTILLPNHIQVGAPKNQIIFLEDFEKNPVIELENQHLISGWKIGVGDVNLNGPKCAFIQNKMTANLFNKTDAMITPVISLLNFDQIRLQFNHAYALRPNKADSFYIYASSDAGLNWQNILTIAEDGTGNFATAGPTTDDFVPFDSTYWCFGGGYGAPCFDIDLSAYSGASNFRLKFVNKCQHGNVLIIDDIKITGRCILDSIFPPSILFTSNTSSICEGDSIYFTDLSSNADQLLWHIPGANPEYSTSKNPTFQFLNEGTYNLTLKATNYGGDSYSNNFYVDVYPNPTPQVFQQGHVLTAQPANVDYQWYFNGTLIPGANSPYFEALTNGAYQVEFTNIYGCKAISPPYYELGVSPSKESDWFIHVFPNPSADFVHVSWSNSSVNLIRLINPLGQIIHEATPYSPNEFSFDMRSYAAGMYIIQFLTKNGRTMERKLLVSR